MLNFRGGGGYSNHFQTYQIWMSTRIPPASKQVHLKLCHRIVFLECLSWQFPPNSPKHWHGAIQTENLSADCKFTTHPNTNPKLPKGPKNHRTLKKGQVSYNARKPPSSAVGIAERPVWRRTWHKKQQFIGILPYSNNLCTEYIQ